MWNKYKTWYRVAKQYDIHCWQFDGNMSTVQPPSECFWSGAAGDSLAAILATFGGSIPYSIADHGSNFQYVVSY